MAESTHTLDDDEGNPDTGTLTSVESPAIVEEAPAPFVEEQTGSSEPEPVIAAADVCLKENVPVVESPTVAEKVVSEVSVHETSVPVTKTIPAGELSADDDTPSAESSAVVEEVSIVPVDRQAASTESEHFVAEVPTVTEVPVEEIVELPSVTAESVVEVKDEDVAPTSIIPLEEDPHSELAPAAKEPPTQEEEAVAEADNPTRGDTLPTNDVPREAAVDETFEENEEVSALEDQPIEENPSSTELAPAVEQEILAPPFEQQRTLDEPMAAEPEDETAVEGAPDVLHATLNMILERLQILDNLDLDWDFRKRFIVATQRISAASGLYPTCNALKNVVDISHQVNGGGHGDIFEGTFQGRKVCIKAVRGPDEQKKIFKQSSKEAILWGQLSHPNVLQIFGLFHSESLDRLCLVAPWMQHEDLTNYLTQHPNAPRLLLALDVSKGLQHCPRGPQRPQRFDRRQWPSRSRRLWDIIGIRPQSQDSGVDVAVVGSFESWWQAPEILDPRRDNITENTFASDIYTPTSVSSLLEFKQIFTSCTEALQEELAYRGSQNDLSHGPS
ncbi:hypothetical protein H0H93_011829 [Arthromyces matolae]|nr:hypothetical protein H0H93_011829 [Arthromyces matolae]